jgi:hypothetical protein
MKMYVDFIFLSFFCAFVAPAPSVKINGIVTDGSSKVAELINTASNPDDNALQNYNFPHRAGSQVGHKNTFIY